MTDVDRLERRLAAVERVVVDGDATVDELAELTALADSVGRLETRLAERERRLGDLEAAVESIEGYVGNVESISDDVERRAASAVATTDRLERRVDALEVELDDVKGGILEPENGGTDRDRETPRMETTDRNAGANDDEPSDFEFGRVERRAERSARELFDESSPTASEANGSSTPVAGDGTPIVDDAPITDDGTSIADDVPVVDDGVDRPASSATQSRVETAVDTSGPRAAGDDEDERSDGLLGSIRSRIS